MIAMGTVSVSQAEMEELKLPSVQWAHRSLDQWQSLIRESSLSDLSATEMVDGMRALVVDEAVPDLIRRQAAIMLGRIGRPARRAVPEVQQQLAGIRNGTPDDEELLRTIWALKSLALFGSVAEQAAPDVADIVLDESLPLLIRVNAMETLGRIGKESAVALPTYVTILNSSADRDSPRELHMAAADCLWHLGPGAAPAIPQLLDALQDDWSLTRRAAATTLGKIGPLAEIAIPALVDTVLFDDAGEVRESAADALGMIGLASHGSLAQLITDREEAVRKLAIRGTALLPAKQAQPLLETACHDTSPLIRALSADALIQIAPKSNLGITVLIDLLSEPTREPSITAYRALLNHAAHLGEYESQLNQLIASSTSSRTIQVAQRIVDAIPSTEDSTP